MTDNASKVLEAVKARQGWVNVVELAEVTGLNRQELKAAAEELLAGHEAFAAEPEPFGHRITKQMKELAPEIGGEQRHKFAWQSWAE